MKEQRCKFGPRLSLLHAKGHALFASGGYLRRAFGDDDCGFYWELPAWLRHVIIVYSEEQATAVREDHRRALAAFGAHKRKQFLELLQKDHETAEKRYREALEHHRMIGTPNCLMTEEDIDEALGKLNSETARQELLKQQCRIWMKGAGWSKLYAAGEGDFKKWPNIKQPFSKKCSSSKKRVDFKSDYLAGKLKELITNNLIAGRPIRNSVPMPSHTVSDPVNPDAFGDVLSDVLSLQEELDEDERKRIRASHEEMGITLQPANMPTPASLEKKRIEMIFVDTEDEHVLLWYAGKVLSASASKDGILAKIEWEGEFSDPDQKVTEEELTEERWAGQDSCLEEWSWRLA